MKKETEAEKNLRKWRLSRWTQYFMRGSSRSLAEAKKVARCQLTLEMMKPCQLSEALIRRLEANEKIRFQSFKHAVETPRVFVFD